MDTTLFLPFKWNICLTRFRIYMLLLSLSVCVWVEKAELTYAVLRLHYNCKTEREWRNAEHGTFWGKN